MRSPDGGDGAVIRRLGRAAYEPTWRAMREFTDGRDARTPDEVWLVEHPPVYTVGVAGRAQHLPRSANAIPVAHIDRGGQITYHGPGQIVLYTLLDLGRRGLSVRTLVRTLESAVIDLLERYGVHAEGRLDAPGVYVNGAKVAALGLRVRHGCCYHGLALNVDMDLSPFLSIDPCGYPGLAVTSMRELAIQAPIDAVGDALIACVLARLAARV